MSSSGTRAPAQPPRERSLESLALAVGAISAVIVALLALIVFRLAPAPIAGSGSLGQFAALAAAVVAIVAYIAGRYVARRPDHAPRILDIVDVAALAFAHAVIALLTWTLLADILERGFQDAVVFGLSGLLLAGAAAAVTAYVVFFSSTHMDLQLLALVLAVFLVEGIIASMLTASDPHWWQDNLSALGMTNDMSALAFNLTLIVGGVIVTTLARYSTRDIHTARAGGATRVRVCLIIVGIFLALVGVFPVDRFFWVHTSVASGMAVAFAVLVIRLDSWVPTLSRGFVLLGWLFIAVIAVLAVLFGIGYYTLTAVELVAGILIFSWIILFLRNIAALQQDAVGSGERA